MRRRPALPVLPLTLACLLTPLAAPAGRAADEGDYMLATAADLAALCAAPQDASAIHMCEGFLVAVDQMHMQLASAMDRPIYCLPTDGSVTRDGAAAAFAAWMAGRPANATLSPIDGLMSWARDAYPCPAGQ
ncbi:hypothetical protein FDP22_21405 (plasmid) [Paroceanicella profunda]|uniref:Rap1a immunity protein domain-containing protein n=1 Tax=Paroceanicella profunda TaxID=2579971 RepID=A0A5B8FJ26_9RHOB|nr:Rap1a/Tai family immunity protein [Paroceanicella profunda]QDL94431.1 hypothetical protein FDP22_21405 [Paroceanicella profunda]